MAIKDRSSLEKANELVSQFAANVGVFDAALGADNDTSFGEFGFSFDPIGQMLTARVYIGDAFLTGEYAQPEHFGRVLNALKTDTVHDRAAGEFTLDQKKEMFFLTRSFPVEGTSTTAFREEMANLLNVGAQWRANWFLSAVKTAHAQRGAATHHVGGGMMRFVLRATRSSKK